MFYRTLLLALFTPLTALANPILVVQVRTDLQPFTDFQTLSAVVTNPQTGQVVARGSRPAQRTDNYAAGIRLIEQPLPAGRYIVEAKATAANGRTVVERSAQVDVRQGVETVTIFLSRPAEAPAPNVCQREHSQARRVCGQVAARCLAEAGGNRDRINACHEGNQGCQRSAQRAFDQCRQGN